MSGSVKFLLFFFFISTITFSQKRVSKKFTSSVREISISTDGLDDFVLENSEAEFIEIFLYAENPNKQHIIVDEKASEIEIRFKIPIFKNEEEVFRKYITKRLKRASAIIKIPNNMDTAIFGETINVTSKSYRGNLRIFIENGIVKLDTIQQNLELKVYAGNVFGEIKKTNLSVVSKTGKIKIDTLFHQKKYEEKEVSTTTIKGNIFLTHQ